MAKLYKLFISKVLALLLSFLLFYGNSGWGTPQRGEPEQGDVGTTQYFDSALKEYNNGLYDQAKTKLEKISSATGKDSPVFNAKIFLLLGACYEKLGKKVKARDCFLELKSLLDDGSIDQIPAVEGVETETLNEYKEVFGESYFKFKKPVPAAEMIKKNVVQAPKKSIEKKQKEKRRKKFPWLIAIGVVLIAGTTAVLLLTKKSKEIKVQIPKIEWIRIPAGEFQMGDNFNEGQADELPVHTVYLDEYYISKYEITIEEFFPFCDDTGRTKPVDANSTYTSTWRPRPVLNFPIYNVSWDDAKAFCDWLSQKTGENINLPTEAQWEKAARGTYQYRYPWGDSPPDEDRAYYGKKLGNNRVSVVTLPGGVSPYGNYHMAGNVAEWCRDWYSSTYYSVSPKKNPTGPASGSYRVIRGGSFKDDAHGIRSANRDSRLPGTKNTRIGIRIVKEK